MLLCHNAQLTRRTNLPLIGPLNAGDERTRGGQAKGLSDLFGASSRSHYNNRGDRTFSGGHALDNSVSAQ